MKIAQKVFGISALALLLSTTGPVPTLQQAEAASTTGYNGTASVQVYNSRTKSYRYLEVTEYTCNKNEASAKGALQEKLKYERAFHETFSSSINYSLTTCVR